YALLSLRTLPPPTSTLFPYTTLFRSHRFIARSVGWDGAPAAPASPVGARRLLGHRQPRPFVDPLETEPVVRVLTLFGLPVTMNRSEEHTSELQSLAYLVCRLLLEKKK